MKKILLFAICSLVFALSCDTNFNTLEIVYSSPADNTSGILPDFYVEIEFNNDVNRTDVEDNFSIKGGGDVSGSFNWISGRKFRYIPDDPVTKTGRYVMEIPRSVRDIDGNIMDTDFISDFYIGTDFTPPEILSSDPPFTTGAADNIPVNQNITVNFSKSMNRESVEKAFSISPDVAGYFVWAENTPGMSNSRLTYVLLAQMTYGKLYSLNISGSAGDTAGNTTGSEYRVSFITGTDFTPPAVTGIYNSLVSPGYWSNIAVNTGISRTTAVAVDFSEAMDRISVEKAFSVTPAVNGNCSWDSDSKLIFTPSSPFEPETNYQIYIDKSAKDMNNLNLNSAYSVEIKTSAADSLYLKCGMIWGSNDNIAYNLLSTGVPLPADWPMIIAMGTGTPEPNYYYIRIQFVSSISPYSPVNINKYSVIGNILIETFKSGPSGVTVVNAKIDSIDWVDGSTATIRLSPLTNKLSGHIPALYKLSFTGGADGIKDINGNPSESDIVIEFREAL